MKTRLITTLILLALTQVIFAETEVWNYEIELETDKTYEYNSLDLNKEVYKHSKFTLGDLRIVDESNGFVPFFLNTLETMEEVERQEEPMVLLNNYPYKEHQIYDFKSLQDEIDTNFKIDTLKVHVDAQQDFFQYVEVWGSHDLEHWTYLKTDELYQVDKTRDYEIDFDTFVRYPHIRLIHLDVQPHLRFTGLTKVKTIEYSTDLKEASLEKNIVFNQTEKNKVTEIIIPAYANCRIEELNLLIEGMYNRRAEVYLVDKEGNETRVAQTYIYQSTVNERNVHNVLKWDTYGTYEKVLIRIYNENDRALSIQGIDLKVKYDTLVFAVEEDHDYRLLMGNANANYPKYDISSFKSEINKEEHGKSKLKTLNQVEISFIDDKRIDTNVVSVLGLQIPLKRVYDIAIMIVAISLVLVALKAMNKKDKNNS